VSGAPYVPGPSDGYCAGGCAGPHKPGRLMCLSCWQGLPRDVRRDVLVTWWAVWTVAHHVGAAGQRGAQLATLRNDYRRARRRALAAAKRASARGWAPPDELEARRERRSA
jgi:hypothetical protein